jgi:uncharacterized protein YqhQ
VVSTQSTTRYRYGIFFFFFFLTIELFALNFIGFDASDLQVLIVFIILCLVC